MIPRGDEQTVGSGSGTSGSTRTASSGVGLPTGGDGLRPGGVVRAYGNPVNLSNMEKLRGRENYASWAFAMKMTLIREGSWRAVKPLEGQAVDPETSERALAAICLSIEKNIYSLVKNVETAKEAWEKLQKAFQDNGLLRRFGLLDKLTSVKLEEIGSVEDYVDVLVTTAQSLSEIGFEVNDQWLASILLKGLPEYYNPMIMGMEASGIELTADLVKAKILQDVKWPLKGSGAEGALYTKQNHKSRHAKTDKKSGTCFNCRKPGHFAAQCPQKQPTKGKGKALCAMMAVGRGKEEDWYFDSAASSHMTRSEEGFKKHETVVNSIDTANNQSIKSVARGFVELDLKEGSIEVQNVLLVPDLATNLLSISQICKKRLKVVFTASKCEVLDNDGTVIASGTEEDGLYRLNQRIEKSFLTVDSNIWHKRLGHLNQQSMVKLLSMADGIVLKKEALQDCIACLQGKHARDTFRSSSSRAEGVYWTWCIRMSAVRLKFHRLEEAGSSSLLSMMQLGRYSCIVWSPKVKSQRYTSSSSH